MARSGHGLAVISMCACAFMILTSLVHPQERTQEQPFQSAFRAGTAAMQAGRLSDAANYFTNSATLNPNFADAYLNLGIVLSDLALRMRIS